MKRRNERRFASGCLPQVSFPSSTLCHCGLAVEKVHQCGIFYWNLDGILIDIRSRLIIENLSAGDECAGFPSALTNLEAIERSSVHRLR